MPRIMLQPNGSGIACNPVVLIISNLLQFIRLVHKAFLFFFIHLFIYLFIYLFVYLLYLFIYLLYLSNKDGGLFSTTSMHKHHINQVTEINVCWEGITYWYLTSEVHFIQGSFTQILYTILESYLSDSEIWKNICITLGIQTSTPAFVFLCPQVKERTQIEIIWSSKSTFSKV